MSDYLPKEVLIQILARLPVKPLVKFRCVSKSWYFLISSPDFINTHLNFNLNNNNHDHNLLLLKHTYKTNMRGCYYSLNDGDSLDECAHFECPFKGNCSIFLMVGSCNGLLCFFDFHDTKVIICNPSIEKSVTLPTPSLAHSRQGLTKQAFGFGLDYRTNEYKVVSVLQRISEKDWSKIYAIEVELCEVYTNGVFHWVALEKRGVNGGGHRCLIVTFDLVDEVFRGIACPVSIADLRVADMSIGRFEESLVMYHINQRPLNENEPSTCSVWLMKEYGDAKSWVNQFNIVLEGGVGNVQCLMKNGELLLGTTDGQLVLYNPKDQQTKDVGFRDLSIRSGYVDTFMESLVLLKGGQTNSCDAVTSKRKEDDEEQQCRTTSEGAKTTKKTRLTNFFARLRLKWECGIKYELVGKNGKKMNDWIFRFFSCDISVFVVVSYFCMIYIIKRDVSISCTV